MLNVADIIPPDGVLLHLKASSLDAALSQVGSLAAELTGLRAAVIHEALMERVNKGVNVGHGVIIPHARIENLRRIVGFFARPLLPIEYADHPPITMMFVLLAPEDADAGHLQLLSKIAGILRNEEARATLLHGEREAIYQLLTSA